MKTVTLNNGLKMPQLGLGVWKADNGQEAINAIHWSLDAGYRHIDTASIYKNEEAVGEALKIHWPVDGYVAAWKEFEVALDTGKVRAIGVSNFMEEHLEDLLQHVKVVPAVNQIEYHPYLVQADAISLCDMHNIAITAWSPLMQGKFKEEPVFAEIAKVYGKSPAQVILRWCLQNDIIAIPKSTNEGRIHENGDIFDFELNEEHMVAIDNLERNHRFGPDPLDFNF